MNNRYPYLPEGREIKYVPVTDIFMNEAMNMRNNFSTDKNHPTGAVGTFENKIVAKASNQSKLKNKKLIELHRNGLCIRRLLKIPSGQKYWLCPGCANYHQHSEYQVATEMIKKGIKAGNVYLYGHWWCCKPCWDAMIRADVKDVYLVDNADELFKK